jgi:hypothetical protein
MPGKAGTPRKPPVFAMQVADPITSSSPALRVQRPPTPNILPGPRKGFLPPRPG